jgi:thiamine biosynthesis lipoprotein
VDPRTGYPVSHTLLSATILAPDATLADAFATCCMVIGLEESQQFISSQPDLEGCLIYDDAGEFKIWTSEGFSIN